MTSPVRLGLIGCGAWGWRYLPSALEAGNAVVTHVAGCTGLPQYRNNVPPVVTIESGREWRKLLDAPVDAFVVTTPPDTHEEIACALLRAGRPVMLEKPMALDLGASLRIMQAARKSGAPLLVNHQHLFATAYEELCSRSAGWRECGVLSAGGGLGPTRDYSALWDYGPHDVAMFLGLEPSERPHLLTMHDGGEPGVVGPEVMRAERQGGLHRIALNSRRGMGLVRVWNDRGPKTRSFAVHGDGGMLVYNDLDVSASRLRENGLPVPLPYEPPLTRALRAFAEAVRTGGSTDWRFGADVGVEVTRVLALADERIGINVGA